MKSSVHITALNASELAEIEDAVDRFFEYLYEYASRSQVNLPDFAGRIGWWVCKKEANLRLVHFEFSFDDQAVGVAVLGSMEGIATETLLKIISGKIKPLLRIIFNGKIHRATYDPGKYPDECEMLHVNRQRISLIR